MYCDGNSIYKRKNEELSLVYREAKRFNAKYHDLFVERTKDWMFTFFYAFGISNMADDYRVFVKSLNEHYFDQAYDKYSYTQGSEIHELSLIRYVTAVLSELCDQVDRLEIYDESLFIPVKFFMLACIAKEQLFRQSVLNSTLKSRVNATESLFAKLSDYIDDITRADFKEFNSKYMVEKFYEDCVIQYAGLNYTSTNPSDRRILQEAQEHPLLKRQRQMKERAGLQTPLSVIQQQQQSPLNRGPSSPLLEDYHNSSDPSDIISNNGFSPNIETSPNLIIKGKDDSDGDSEYYNTNHKRKREEEDEDPEEKQRKKEALKKYHEDLKNGCFPSTRVRYPDCVYNTLPENYALKGSPPAQTEALSKRTRSISFYAIICSIISFQLDHLYGIGLPRGLRFEGVTKTEDLKPNSKRRKCNVN